jgi:hypothetical protein
VGKLLEWITFGGILIGTSVAIGIAVASIGFLARWIHARTPQAMRERLKQLGQGVMIASAVWLGYEVLWHRPDLRRALLKIFSYATSAFGLVVAASIVIPYGLSAVGRRTQARREWMKSHCIKCGYDLRASGYRCPECGTAVYEGRCGKCSAVLGKKRFLIDREYLCPICNRSRLTEESTWRPRRRYRRRRWR